MIGVLDSRRLALAVATALTAVCLLAVAGGSDAAAPAHRALALSQSRELAASRYSAATVLVGFRPGVSAARRARIERWAGARSGQRLVWSRGLTRAARALERRLGSSYALRVASGHVAAAIARLRADRQWVRYAEPDYAMAASAASATTTIPNDPSFNLLWGDQNTGQAVNGSTGTAGADDGAAKAWTVSTGSPSIVIGEVDTGIDYNHPDLAANVWSNPGGVGGCATGTHGYNVIKSTCNPMDDDTSYGGHGTHVAGIMGAVGNNATGVAGMNWHTTLLPVKWLDSTGWGDTSGLISALNWVLMAKQAGVNIHVVNDSATFVGTAYSQALSDEIDTLGANGILFVTAAGNTGQNNDVPAYTRYPCGYDRPTEICVTASDQNDALPSWANYGPNTVDLAAPGNNIYSTLRNNTYGYIDGGSMAAAEVSGAASLILSVSPALTPTSLKADILSNVDPIAGMAGLTRTGGRLDVCKAMPGCGTTQPPPPPPAPGVVTAPTISGTPVVGQTLTASTGTWTNSPTSYSYAWSRCTALGVGCLPAGVTTASYPVTAADVGSTLEVTVTATNGGGSTPASSQPTAVVTTPPPPPAPVLKSPPTIAGNPVVGQTLTASSGTWTNSPTSYTYAWSRCTAAGTGCLPTGNLTSSYALTAADAGSTLEVTVTATNAGGSTPASSQPTAVVTTTPKTFGYASVGGSGDTFLPNRKRVNAYTITTSASVTSLSMYLAPTGVPGSADVEGVIYTDSGGAPSALLGVSTQLVFSSGQAAGWYTMSFSSPVSLAPGRYWIGVITGGGSGVAGFRYHSVSGARDYNANSYSAGPSNPFGPVSTDSEQMSLYATYS